MAGFMKVILLGNLTRDPDLRGTPSGTSVCELGVAVNTGRREDPPYFGQVVVWGKQAELCKQYLAKGSQVLVEGKLRNEEWEDRQTGQKRTKTRIVADVVQFIGRTDNAHQNAGNAQYSGYPAPAPAPTPAPAQHRGIDPRAPYAPPLPAAPEKDTEPDQDIPF